MQSPTGSMKDSATWDAVLPWPDQLPDHVTSTPTPQRTCHQLAPTARWELFYVYPPTQTASSRPHGQHQEPVVKVGAPLPSRVMVFVALLDRILTIAQIDIC